MVWPYLLVLALVAYLVGGWVYFLKGFSKRDFSKRECPISEDVFSTTPFTKLAEAGEKTKEVK